MDDSTTPSGSPRFNIQQYLLPGAILIAALIIAGTLISTRGGGTAQIGAQPTPDNKPVEIALNDQDHILGNKDAPITIVEFSDFQCPFCRSFFEGAYAQIKKDYIDTGKAKIAYRHFPLDFHPQAYISAYASECAAEQGKFWEFHDKLYQEQAKQGNGTVQYTTSDIKRWAASLKLNAKQFNQCLDSNKYKERVESDVAYASSIGINGTPSFFINGKRLVGAQPFSAFQALFEEAK